MNLPVRPYLGESAEARIAQRRRLLIDAAYRAIQDGRWRDMSINELCRLASLTKRYFYENFQNLDEVAGAIIHEHTQGLITLALKEAAAMASRGLPADMLAQGVIRILIEYLTDDPWRARILFTDIAESPLAREARDAAISRLEETVVNYSYQFYESDGETDPLVPLTASLLVGGTIKVILNWLAGKIPMPREQLIADLAAMWNMNGDAAAVRARARVKQRS